MPGVRLTLSQDAAPAQPTILITQDADSNIFVNVLGVHESQGAAVAQLLHDIAGGLEEVFVGDGAAAKGQHLDSENQVSVSVEEQPAPTPPMPRPKFAPHA